MLRLVGTAQLSAFEGLSMWDSLLKDRVAIITGAASGIGRATAVLFARHGARVIVADINPSAGEATVQQIQAAGGEAIFVHTDVADSGQTQAMARTALERFGRIDVLFNN